MNRELILIQNIFKKNQLTKYNFSKVHFIYKRMTGVDKKKEETYNDTKWKIFQILYLIWAKWSYLINSKTANNNRQFEKNFMLVLKSEFQKIGLLKGNVLDLGGGSGSYSSFYKTIAGKVYIVHDPQIDNFNYLTLVGNPVYMVSDYAEQLPYKNGVFNTVIIADAIDHFSDSEKAFRESIRVLDGHGKIMIIQCQNILNQKDYISKIYQRLKIWISQRIHINHMSEKEILELFFKAGFLKVKIRKRKIKYNPVNLVIYTVEKYSI